MEDDQQDCVSDSTASPKAKPPTSSKPLQLTPSEIESLRRDKQQASERVQELIAADKKRAGERPTRSHPTRAPLVKLLLAEAPRDLQNQQWIL